jgi:hypothetical protein
VLLGLVAGVLMKIRQSEDAPQIAHFSRSLGIDGSAACTNAFMIMALAWSSLASSSPDSELSA